MLKFADAVESRGEEIVAAESENTGKPIGLTTSEELSAAVDQLQFFAGAARVLEGKSAGEYMVGHTSYVRREQVGVIGQVAPWNYPMGMAV
jgi:betaine-aldehyde dehydrogenase